MTRCTVTHDTGRRCQLHASHWPIRHCAQIGDAVTAWTPDRADVTHDLSRVFAPGLAGKLPWCEAFPTDEPALFDVTGVGA